MPGMSGSLGAAGRAAKGLRSANRLMGSVFGTTAMAHRFTVHIDKTEYNLGTWTRVAGLQVSWQICELRTGEQWNQLFLYPGQPKYQTVKLTRAACEDSETVKHWLEHTSKTCHPYTGAIQLVDWMGLEVVHWTLKGLFPQSWSITEFDAGGTKVAMETLEIAHSGFLNDEVTLGKQSAAKVP